MGEALADRPPVTSHADVTLVTRGVTVTALVEASSDDALTVRPIAGTQDWGPTAKTGDRVQVFWVGGYEERMLPAEVSDVDEGAERRWQLSITGPAGPSQRRRVV